MRDTSSAGTCSTLLKDISLSTYSSGLHPTLAGVNTVVRRSAESARVELSGGLGLIAIFDSQQMAVARVVTALRSF
jgi:hypothetical protein